MQMLYAMFLALALIGSENDGGKMSEKVVVFWIAPQIETYVPVTMENIENMAFKVVSVNNDRQADQILNLIQTSNQGPDSKKIRIKISTGGRFYDFDANGTGISSKGETVKIDIQKLKQLLCE